MPQQAAPSVSLATTPVPPPQFQGGMGGKARTIVMHVLIHHPQESSAAGRPRVRGCRQGYHRGCRQGYHQPCPLWIWLVGLSPPCALLAATSSHGNQCYRSCIMQKSVLLFVTKLLFCRSLHAPSLGGDDALWSRFSPALLRPQDSKLHLCSPTALPSLQGDPMSFPVPTTSLLRCSHQTLIYRAFQNSIHAIASHMKHKATVCL